MKEVRKLSENEIHTYEKMSGAKIDLTKQPDAKHVNWYYIISNGKGRWRSYEDLINYINFKIDKSLTEKNNKELNNNLVKNVKKNLHNILF